MPQESPTKRSRRRRWIIVGVLLFVLLTAWWYWPRGDRRFVGTWQLWDGNHDKLLGSVQFSQYGSSDFGSNFFRAWTVRGDQLVFGWTSPEDQIATFDELVLFYQRLMTHIVVIEGDRYDILNCSANEIELRLERSNQLFTLRRQTECVGCYYAS